MKSSWMLVAGFCFAVMGVFVKFANAWFSSTELVFYRSVIGLALVLAFAVWLHRGATWRQLAGRHAGLHIRRGLIGFAALVTFFYSMAELPLAAAMTLNYSSPLFLALLMPFSLRERPSLAQYASVVLGFLGVVLLLQPWRAGGALLPGLAGLASGFFAAVAYVHVRRLGRLHEPEWRTVFWFAVVCSAGAAMLVSAGTWHPLTPESLGLLISLGLFATAGQLAMTRAYRLGETALVSSFAFSAVVFGSLFDVLIWNHTLSALQWTGIAITVGAGLWAVQLNKGSRQ